MSTPRIEVLAGELETLRSELDELDALEEPTEEQSTRMGAALTEWDEKKAAHDGLVERAAKVEAVRSAVLNPATSEPGFHAPMVNRQVDPFENLEAVRAGHVPAADLKSRALSAIENDKDIPEAHREAATQLVQELKGASRLAMLTGSPAYRSAFEKIVEFPESYQAYLEPAEKDALRAAMSTTSANGGYAIPFLLDPTIILTNAGATNPFRQVSTIVRGTSNIWNGVTSAGVTAEWKGEGSQAADASPTLGTKAITAYQADAYVFGSYEVFEDTNLASQLPLLIADAKDRLEADAFAIGSGSGAPFGVVTSVTAVTASRVAPTTGGTFTASSSADIFTVLNAVPARHRGDASWLANFATYNTIRQMSPLAAGSSFWVTLGGGQPSQLTGLPVLEASSVVSAATTGSNILLCGNFSRYYIFDRIGMQLEYVPMVFGANQRPSGQRGWFATWRVGADVVDPAAFRVLKL